MKARRPPSESARADALERYEILDTLQEQAYDDITRIAAHVAQTPIALVSLVDRHRQWFKSRIGLAASETPREYAFCAHAILRPDEPLIVKDATHDERFADNPLVTGEPKIRFYLGAPLVTPDRYALGTLCVIDRVPRDPHPDQVEAIAALSRQVIAQLELRRYAADMRQAAADREVYLAQLQDYQRKLEQANAQLKEESLTDRLTGIGNRAALDQRLDEEIYRSNRYGSPLSLLLIDIDNFKQYNDAFGHPAGDAALQAIGKLLRTVPRPSDFVARYGGEEFAVVLPTTADQPARAIAERIRDAIEHVPLPHRAVTASIGVSTLAAGSTDAARLVAAADQALYAAKQGGRNRVVVAPATRGEE